MQTNNSTFQMIYFQQEKTFLSIVIHNYEYFGLIDYFKISSQIKDYKFAFSFNLLFRLNLTSNLTFGQLIGYKYGYGKIYHFLIF